MNVLRSDEKALKLRLWPFVFNARTMDGSGGVVRETLQTY